MISVYTFTDETCQPDNATCVTEVRNATYKLHYTCIQNLLCTVTVY